jgi:L-fuculose-phosphate aldolase
MNDHALREQVCEIGRRLYQRGLIAGSEGNLSIRMDANRVLCTPTLVSKGFLRPDELPIVDMDGRQLSGPRARTSEILLHLAIYRNRAEVNAAIHSHPPHATAFAVTGKPIPLSVHPELDFFLGPVPTAPYLLPGTSEFADSIVPYLDRTSAVLLANHGTVTFGATLEWAWILTETLDSYCRLLINAAALGPTQCLSESQVAELLQLKKRCGMQDPRLDG